MKKKKTFNNDLIYKPGSWKFNTNVAKIFDTHVRKSIPFYDYGHDMIVKFAQFFLSKDSIVTDIGCSTGTLIKKIHDAQIKKKIGLKYLCIEKEKSMLIRAKKKLKNIKNIKFINKKIENYKIPKSDLIISYYTLQFIKPNKRQEILKMIYNSLNWGGAFIIFEKTRSEDARFQDLTTQLYYEFKLENGFNGNEIIEKSRSLIGVLEPFSLSGNSGLLTRAGFKFKKAGFVDSTIIFKNLNFTGFLLIK
tara:strand:- start:701 stop:1447 length:747 start_codon:yes stop_codon:yes gene_type:complete